MHRSLGPQHWDNEETDMSLHVIRNWAAKKSHVAEVPEELLYPIEFFGSRGNAVVSPVVAMCRTELNRDPIVVMTKAAVDCVPCARISGIARVPAEETSE